MEKRPSTPTVSILIPCYNRAEFIADAIDSALSQTYSNIEVIVVDDGSRDNSWQIISSYGNRIKSKRIDNGGAPRARNEAVRLATGQFIKFLDSDDMLYPDIVSIQIERIMEDVSIPVARATCIDTQGSVVEAGCNYNLSIAPNKQAIPRRTLLSESVQISLPLFPRPAYERVGGLREDLIISEDYDLMLRLHRAGYEFRYCPEPSTQVRLHSSGRITSDIVPIAFERLCQMYRDHVAAFETMPDMELTEQQTVALARLCWSMGRNAARRSYTPEADALFSLAQSLSGKNGRAGSPFARFLYHVFDPVRAERILEFLKRSNFFALPGGRNVN